MAETFVLPPPPQPSVPILGSDKRFPVRRLYCVGRNYAAHVREMGGDEREAPFFFQKPADAVVTGGGEVPFPSLTEDLQHEVELVLAIGLGGARIPAEDAARHVFGLAVGVDLTRRDLQLQARKAGRPWEAGKAFDHSAPISDIRPLAGAALPTEGRISLEVNGVERQSSDLKEMIWSAAEIISQLSTLFRLEPGDLIFTGTPEGVAKLAVGDRVSAHLDGVGDLAFTVGAGE